MDLRTTLFSEKITERGRSRKRFPDVLAGLLLLLFLFPQVCRCAPGDGASGMDVILVLDTSGSMKYTDPRNMTAEAALLFLNMMEETGCRAGILTFSDEVRTLRGMEPLHMKEQEDELRLLLAQQERGGDTDLGAAAMAALDMAEDNTAVLFFTDGMVDLPDENEKERSFKQAKEAAGLASGRNIPFFCVGLDDRENHSDYHPDRELLEELSRQTGGSFRCVEDAQELPELFHLVFSDYIESRSKRVGDLQGGQEGEQSLNFTIPDGSVLEANVILLPADSEKADPEESFPQGTDPEETKKPDQLIVHLYSPDGTEVKSGNTVRFCPSRAYTLLKLIEPSPGEWRLSVSSEEKYHVHVNLLLHYELELVSEARQETDGTAGIWIRFMRAGEALKDEQLYRQFACSLRLEREDTPGVWEDALESLLNVPYDASCGCYHTQIPVYPGSSVQIRAEAAGETLLAKADVLRFTSRESDAIIVDRLPERITLEGMFPEDTTLTFDTSGLFRSWDGSVVTVRARARDEENLRVRQEQEGLMLQGIKSGSCELILTAQDLYGSRKECRVPVQVQIIWEKVRVLLSAAAGGIAILIFAVFLALHRKNHSMKGTFLLTDEPFSGEEEGISFPLEEFGGKVTMEQVITGKEGGSSGNAGTQGRMLLERYPAGRRTQILTALSLITVQEVRCARKGQRIRLKNRGQGAALFDCYGTMARNVALQDQDTFEIRLRGGPALFGCLDIKE